MWWLFITGALSEPNWNALKKASDWESYKRKIPISWAITAVFPDRKDYFLCFKGALLVNGILNRSLKQ